MESNKQYVKQFVQPEITKKKFDEELNDFLKITDIWRKKGVFLIEEKFPDIDFMFIAQNLKPQAVAYAVRINFINYDVEPPSLKFICPIAGTLLKRKDILLRFNQYTIQQPLEPGGPSNVLISDLLQGPPDEVPFFCIPGVREYHLNPYHTGDSWFLYRKKGEGKLNFILDQLYNHSIPSIASYSISYNVGFAVSMPQFI